MSQSHFQQAIDSLDRGLISIDAAGRVLLVNPAALEMLKCEKKTVAGSELVDFFPVGAELAAGVMAAGESVRDHLWADSEDKLVLDVLPIRQGEEIKGAVLCFAPLADHEISAKRLNLYGRLDEKFKAIFKLSSDGIWVSDGQGIVLRINRASEKLNGITAEDVVGKNIKDIVDSGFIDSSATLAVLERKRRVNMMQFVSRTKKHLLLTGTPLFDDNGDISLVVVNERDITQLNAVKRQLEHSRMVTEKYKDELLTLSMREFKEDPIVAESEEMGQVLEVAQKLARMGASNILLLGESGTGKGLLAKYIHNNSPRRDKPFIQINFAALPENLLEAELFGYERGAFTGAHERGKAGLFELAQDGTLFLDEVAESPPSAQAKLLKYLDDHEIIRLGGTKPKTIDCTIIAATNRELEEQVKNGNFRKDLFYRLNTFTIKIPPLRQRPDDIFELVTHFLKTYNQRYALNRRITSDFLMTLQSYPFPGNIRELKSIIKKAVVMSDSEILDEHLIESLGQDLSRAKPQEKRPSLGLNQELLKLEKNLLKGAMDRCGTTREMALYLGISQPSVVRKMKRHGLTRR